MAKDKVRSTGPVLELYADQQKTYPIDVHPIASIRSLQFGGNSAQKALAGISAIRMLYQEGIFYL